MLRAVPNHWLSSGYQVLENETVVAFIGSSAFREVGKLTIKGANYRAYREGWMNGAFLLELNGAILARAVKPSSLYRSFQVQCEGREYTLEAESAFLRKFVLTERGLLLGSIYPESALTRNAVIDLPDAISLPERIFMFWLVMIMWKRASDSAAS